jgi:hypothetical protein
MGSVLFARSQIGLPDRPCERSSVAHLTGATDDPAINLGAFNAPTPPKSRDSERIFAAIEPEWVRSSEFDLTIGCHY